ncbi:MAG: hypothetical protein A3F14_05940 [Gammaproteobacteria bacterium RIFCSPHIGHO2_12_FULL_43_28]|nr:MAG: hypothetical protein A3F14_05940 [Gammaproteobacteria bacterium RIFCSPHIGHO2_12_FULL_43_28]
MTQIDFYVLDQGNKREAESFACRLLEKAVQTSEVIYVHTASLLQAQQLDALLWTYREDSFLPHALYDEEKEAAIPIRIGFAAPDTDYLENMATNGLLVNLTTETPAFYRAFPRMMEIVFSDPSMQQLARERYRQYREEGHSINTHKIKAKEA